MKKYFVSPRYYVVFSKQYMFYLHVCSQALIIYKGEHKVEETSSHKMPTQKLKFNSKQKQSDPSYESISDNKESSELQVPIDS
jgi:hypothetical protein